MRLANKERNGDHCYCHCIYNYQTPGEKNRKAGDYVYNSDSSPVVLIFRNENM